jgi:hypothetical protein
VKRHKTLRDWRSAASAAPSLVLACAFLSAAAGHAQVDYVYVGQPFASADAPWSVGGSLQGSITLPCRR